MKFFVCCIISNRSDEYGTVTDLVASKIARGGQGQPSKIERDFTNPMRIMRYVPNFIIFYIPNSLYIVCNTTVYVSSS